MIKTLKAISIFEKSYINLCKPVRLKMSSCSLVNKRNEILIFFNFSPVIIPKNR